MNLNINAPSNSKCNFIEQAIKQKIEVPHVPLKIIFNETDEFISGDFNITILIDPKIYLKNYLVSILPSDLEPHRYLTTMSEVVALNKIELAVKKYCNFYNINNYNLIYLYDNFENKIEQTVLNLFDKLNLDENNYKNKTGSKSLRDDVINKKIDIKNYLNDENKYNRIPYKLKEILNTVDTKEMFDIYNNLKNKAEHI